MSLQGKKRASYDLSHHAQLGQIRNDDALFRYANRHFDVYFDGTHFGLFYFPGDVGVSSKTKNECHQNKSQSNDLRNKMKYNHF